MREGWKNTGYRDYTCSQSISLIQAKSKHISIRSGLNKLKRSFRVRGFDPVQSRSVRFLHQREALFH